MIVDFSLRASDLKPALERFWATSGEKLDLLARRQGEGQGPFVHTVSGRYEPRPWTDWTLGFQIGSYLLHFDATGEQASFELGRKLTMSEMGPYLTDFGVHDHGFNVVSTYGNLWRLMEEGKAPEEPGERFAYEQALRVSGAVQAKRWATTGPGQGFIYSFQGPHSLYVDTVRTLRSLALAHLLGQSLRDEAAREVSLLERLEQHLVSTARYNVYYGAGRDIYDVKGRVAHEAVFSSLDGSFRAPGTQQGYSPFSTWSRGLSWAVLGFAEELEFLGAIGAEAVTAEVLEAAEATCDFYISAASASDGVPYWDTGAPGLAHLGDWRSVPADPYNAYEPVDSSAAAIAAQGLLRLGKMLANERYLAASLTIARTLFAEPYLCQDKSHEGLVLHSLYHRPAGWDHVPPGRSVPCGEATMWGDYHARELALCITRLARGEALPRFFGPNDPGAGAAPPRRQAG